MENFPNHSKKPRGNIKQNLLSGIRTALLAVLPLSCATRIQIDRTPDNELADTYQPGRVTKRLIESDSGVGKVVHIRNWHGKHFKRDDPSQEGVTEYQMRVFEDFIYAKPKAVLSEGSHYRESTPYLEDECRIKKNGEGIDCRIDLIMSGLSEEQLLILEKIKQSGTTKVLADEERLILRELLYIYDAFIIYGILYRNENIDWLASESVEAINTFNKAIYEANTATRQIRMLKFSGNNDKTLSKRLGDFNHAWEEVLRSNDIRENQVAEHLKEYFKDHPDATVFLLFGAIHNFCDNLDGVQRLDEVYYEVLNIPEEVVTTKRCDQSHIDEQLKPKF